MFRPMLGELANGALPSVVAFGSVRSALETCAPGNSAICNRACWRRAALPIETALLPEVRAVFVIEHAPPLGGLRQVQITAEVDL